MSTGRFIRFITTYQARDTLILAGFVHNVAVIMIEDSKIENTLTLSYDQLLQELGTELQKGKDDIIPVNPVDAYHFGKFFIESKREELKSKICGNENIQKLINSNSEYKIIVIEILAMPFSKEFGVSPVLLACTILKLILNNFCSEVWE